MGIIEELGLGDAADAYDKKAGALPPSLAQLEVPRQPDLKAIASGIAAPNGEQLVPAAVPPEKPPAPPQKSLLDRVIQQLRDFSLYDMIHPEGSGTTRRGFNDIYPAPGKSSAPSTPDGTVYSDTPGSHGATNDLDYFRKKIYPNELEPGRGGWQLPNDEADFADRIRTLMKTDPALADKVLRQTMDFELNKYRQRALKRASTPLWASS